MVNVNGILKTVSYPLIINMIVGFLFGLFDVGNIGLLFIFLFLISHLLIGLTAPMFNPATPYFSCYIATVTFNFINYLAGTYVFEFYILESPDSVNRNMVLSTIFALVITGVYLKMKVRKGENYA